MASISKIQIESGTFDIKDETARNGVATNIQSIESINNEITTIKGDIETTNANLNTTNTNVTNNTNSINNLDTEKQDKLTEIVLFGDSWTDPTSLDAIWGNLIGEELGLTVHNYAKSGAYMSGTDSISLENQVENYHISDVDKTKVKYIVILGGINDFRNGVGYTVLSSKLIEQIELLKGYSPQAKILYVSNTRYYYDKDQGDYWCGVHQDLRNESKIVTYNMFDTMGPEVFNKNNYFHLTQVGQRIMLSNIIACLTGGEIQYFQNSMTASSANGSIKVTTERVHNMSILTFELTITQNCDNITFPHPNDYYWCYYPLFGGWMDQGYKTIAFDLSAENLIFACKEGFVAGNTYRGVQIINFAHR